MRDALHFATTRRPGNHRHLAYLHGFTQTSRSWAPIIRAIGDDIDATCFDAPGHGDSAQVRGDVAHAADLVADRIRDFDRPTVLVGYSMGGRIALDLAVRHRSILDGLVLVSSTAGLHTESERSDRRRSDETLAHRIEAVGVDVFIDEWLSQSLFTTLSPELADRDDRRRNTSAGLVASLRGCGVGSQEPLWGRLHTIEVPVLLVVGELDAKYRALADEMASAIGAHASVAIIDGAGHTAHLEKPLETSAVIRRWLDESGI